jgi:hypothetical protein
MQLSNLVNLRSKTKFRLTLETYTVVFGLLAAQILLVRVPPLDPAATLVAVLYLVQVSKEVKTRKELFSRKQKHVLFGYECSVYGFVLVGLLIAGLVKRTPIVWITFGLASVFSFVILVSDYERIFKDEGSA